jgi:nitroreductase
MPDLTPDNSIGQLITARRTIHKFKPSPAPAPALLREAIAAAHWAPNHRLTEPWHFYLLWPKTIQGVIQLNTILVSEKHGEQEALKKQERWAGIPGWMALTCDRSADPVRVQEDFAACCCAAQNQMLYLWNMGIGVKWTTGDVIRDPRFYDLLWIDPVAESVVGLFWYGYPEEIPVTVRKSPGQIIIELP